jgi:hypothetical protein
MAKFVIDGAKEDDTRPLGATAGVLGRIRGAGCWSLDLVTDLSRIIGTNDQGNEETIRSALPVLGWTGFGSGLPRMGPRIKKIQIVLLIKSTIWDSCHIWKSSTPEHFSYIFSRKLFLVNLEGEIVFHIFLKTQYKCRYSYTYVHSPLCTHAHTPYPYDHIQKTEPTWSWDSRSRWPIASHCWRGHRLLLKEYTHVKSSI